MCVCVFVHFRRQSSVPSPHEGNQKLKEVDVRTRLSHEDCTESYAYDSCKSALVLPPHARHFSQLVANFLQRERVRGLTYKTGLVERKTQVHTFWSLLECLNPPPACSH